MSMKQGTMYLENLQDPSLHIVRSTVRSNFSEKKWLEWAQATSATVSHYSPASSVSPSIHLLYKFATKNVYWTSIWGRVLYQAPQLHKKQKLMGEGTGSDGGKMI